MARRTPLRSDEALMKVAQSAVRSGFYPNIKNVDQAFIILKSGNDYDLTDTQALDGINIISGKKALSAGLMGSMVQNSGNFDYQVVDSTDESCSIEYFKNGASVGVSKFDMADAKKAGFLDGYNKANYAKYPRNMLFARAMSNGVKTFCLGVFGGPVYTADELGARVDEDGTVITDKSEKATTTEPEAPQGPSLEEQKQELVNYFVQHETLSAYYTDRKVVGEAFKALGITLEEGKKNFQQVTFEDAKAALDNYGTSKLALQDLSKIAEIGEEQDVVQPES